MYCRRCGNELKENAVFCDQCGYKVVEEEVIEEVIDISNVTVSNETKEPKGPWKAFAIVGYVLGIVDLILMLYPFYSMIMSVYGIVLSALGKKSVSKRKYARRGLTMNIIACSVNFVATVALYVVIILLSLNY